MPFIESDDIKKIKKYKFWIESPTKSHTIFDYEVSPGKSRVVQVVVAA